MLIFKHTYIHSLLIQIKKSQKDSKKLEEEVCIRESKRERKGGDIEIDRQTKNGIGNFFTSDV